MFKSKSIDIFRPRIQSLNLIPALCFKLEVAAADRNNIIFIKRALEGGGILNRHFIEKHTVTTPRVQYKIFLMC